MPPEGHGAALGEESLWTPTAGLGVRKNSGRPDVFEFQMSKSCFCSTSVSLAWLILCVFLVVSWCPVEGANVMPEVAVKVILTCNYLSS